MLSHTQKLQLETNNGIMLCRGTNAEGKQFWLYIKANKAAIEKMHRDYEQRNMVDFLEYGEVIKKGVSDEVPPAIRKFMEDNYNFVHAQ